MKSRNFFVSNSSSSSFIIGVNKIPETPEEAADVWFGDKQDSVSISVLRGIFEGLKEFPLDLEKLKESAENKPWEEISGYDEDNVLSELASNFYYSEEYGSGNGFFYSSRPTPMKQWADNEITKRKIKQDDYSAKYKVEKEWFDLPEVRVRFVKIVDEFISEFKEYKLFMVGEFGDDTELGREIEHDFNWEKYFTYRQFSHH
ncbi:MAG: hypothetical protein WC055_00985 [Melioribacteraceae bacterium]